MNKLLTLGFLFLLSSCGQNSSLTIDGAAGPYLPCTVGVYTFTTTGAGTATLGTTMGPMSDHVWEINSATDNTGSISWLNPGVLTLRSSNPQNISGIEIMNSNLTQFSCLMGMTSLVVFNIGFNQVNIIDPDSFKYLTAVSGISLNDNEIEYLHPSTFRTNTNLTVINLNDNLLSNLDPTIFENNTALDRIEIAFNQLGSIPATIFDTNTALTYVDLSSNLLSSVNPAMFSGLVDINHLGIASNALDAASVSGVLTIVDSFGTNNGTLHLDGGTNSAPADTIAFDNLVVRGWDVLKN